MYDDIATATELAASATTMAKAASQMATAAAVMAAAATELAVAATALSGTPRTTMRTEGVTATSDASRSTGKEVALSPFEIFERASQSANKVFDTPELLEGILSCETDISALFIMRRVCTAFKSAIDGSVRIRETMFLAAHRRAPDQSIAEFGNISPLLKDSALTPEPLRHFDFECISVTGTVAELECDCATYYRKRDWESIDSFLYSAEYELGESEEEPARQSWERTRILNVSVPLRVRFGGFVQDELPDRYGERIVLQKDSTLGDLLRALCMYRDSVQRAYIATTRWRFTARNNR